MNQIGPDSLFVGMNRITKQFDTLKQAERYQNRLYNKYSHVRLVQWPSFTENGTYIWEVK